MFIDLIPWNIAEVVYYFLGYSLNSLGFSKYKIISRKIIGINAPYATTMLTDRYVNAFPNKKPLITLATCFEQNGITYPNQRIVVTGELTSIKPIKK